VSDKNNTQEAFLPKSTSPVLLSAIRKYTKKAQNDAKLLMTGQKAKLLPVINFENDSSLSLSFKIGVNRLYVLNNLSEFKLNMENNALASYGKDELYHSPDSFEADSLPTLSFLMKQLPQSVDTYSYYRRSTDKKHLRLNRYTLDSFFESCIDNAVEVIDSERFKAEVIYENPQINLEFSKLREDSFRLTFSPHFKAFMGVNSCYIFIDKKIYVCDSEFTAAAGELLYEISASGSYSFVLQKNDFEEFCSCVLSKVSEFINIPEIPQELDFKALSSLVCKAYIDRLDSFEFFARLEFHYGDKMHTDIVNKSFKSSLDIEKEKVCEACIKEFFTEYDETKNIFLCKDEDKMFDFLSYGALRLSRFAQVFVSQEIAGIKPVRATGMSIGVRLQSNLISLDIDYGSLSPTDVIDAIETYKRKKKFVRLKNGSFLNLESSPVAELYELMQGLDLSPRNLLSGIIEIPSHRAIYLDSVIEKSKLVSYSSNTDFKNFVERIKNVNFSQPQIPQSLENILREYQKTGFMWLKTLYDYGFSGILADDMGLGKTLQVLSLLLSFKDSGNTKPSLVICPSSLVLNWVSEVEKFTPRLKACAVTGNAEERKQILLQSRADIFVTSYELLKRDIEFYCQKSFFFEIIDEAQYIKIHSTQNSKAVKLIKSVHRLALTGTPIENCLAELWSIFDFLMPGYLYSYSRFKTRFEIPIVREGNKQATETLQRLVSAFILRRLKKDVLTELPEKTETVIYSALSEEQERLYVANVTAAKTKISGQLDSSDKLQILALLTRLRQLCCDPSLVYENYTEQSAKLEACLELIEECIASKHKLLLFSQFTSMLEIIQKELVSRGISYYKITGETKADERLGLVNRFNADSTPVFLISLKAGGVGLNLTGADTVIHYDPWWNLSVQNQATDRSYRLGQKKSVQVYKLIAKGTIEEKILKMQQNKAALADSIVKDGDISLAKLSKDEIIELLSL